MSKLTPKLLVLFFELHK